KSCATCLTSFFDHVTKEVDVGKCVVVIYLDMHKAFDQVPHNRLALKLENLGISDPLLKWLKSFLSNRLQSVEINSCISSSLPITSGVIQGSVLGPLLFLIYINDFSSILHTGIPFLFADDCKLVFSFPINQMAMYIELIQQDLQAISEWSKTWLLHFSVNLCSVLPIRCTIPAGTFTLLGSDIPITSCVRDLGVLYSNSLNFSEFVHKQAARAKQMLARININIHDKQARLILYKTCVRPGLEYASFLHTNLKVVDKLKLESLQRSFTKRLIGDNESLTYRERCLLLNLDPLWLRRLKINLSLFHNLLHAMDHSNPSVSLHLKKHYSLRNNISSLRPILSKTKLRSNFFLVKYVKIWNLLPPHIQTIDSNTNFRNVIKRLLTPDFVKHIAGPYIDNDHLYEIGLPNI
ncbi:MAG: reverse transcriptase domain-containing protein, partial [Paraclostridium sp.]|uniref:reverse transcriptase domain-containing protein n=1 Tax=Paraclostridium sp. TaxID=2023273 RepID=UPI003F3849EE